MGDLVDFTEALGGRALEEAEVLFLDMLERHENREAVVVYCAAGSLLQYCRQLLLQRGCTEDTLQTLTQWSHEVSRHHSA